MLKELLISLIEQKKSINQLAINLNTSPEVIRNRLDMLSHLGYLKRIEGCNERHGQRKENKKIDKKYKNKSDRSEKCSIPNYCSNCIIASSCKEKTDPDIKIITGYTLAKKGKKLLLLSNSK